MNYNNVQGKANVSRNRSKSIRGSMANKGANTYNYTLLHKPYSSEPSEYAYREAERLHMTIEAFMSEYAHPRRLRPKGDNKHE